MYSMKSTLRSIDLLAVEQDQNGGTYIESLGAIYLSFQLDPDYYPDWRISTSKNWIPSQKYVTEHLCKSRLILASNDVDN